MGSRVGSQSSVPRAERPHDFALLGLTSLLGTRTSRLFLSARCLVMLCAVLAMWGCTASAQHETRSQEQSDRTSAGRSVGVDTIEEAQVAAALSTTASTTSVPVFVPHLDDILPLPWADFHEMHDPTQDSAGMEITGRLEIEGRCAYIDFLASYETHVEDPKRLVLSLPRGRIQFDPRSNELWIHRRGREVDGPIASGQRISIGGSYGKLRSRPCGNEVIVFTDGIWGCRRWPSTSHPLCEIEEYARLHRVQRDEAQRRFDLFPILQSALDELREIEDERAAGWGLDHGLKFAAWFWLKGADPPSEAARSLADEHDDLEIRVGAAFGYSELVEAQASFADGQYMYLSSNVNDEASEPFELADAVTQSWIDHRENELVVSVDPDQVPRRVAVSLSVGEYGSYPDIAAVPSSLPNDELLATIQRVLERRLDVSLRVTRGLKVP